MNDASTAYPAPRVTVVIAAWKAESTLDRAIESALAQTIPVEVIVVDDASPDSTAAVADSHSRRDRRVTLLRQIQNQGPAAARNRAIAESHAPWIAVLDSDDFMDPERLERLVEIAEAEGLDFLADDLFKVSEDDISGPRTRLWAPEDFKPFKVDAETFVRGNLSTSHGGRREMGFVKPLMRRAFLERYRLQYADMRLGEDYDLYARALIHGARFRMINPMGYVAVVRPGSLSGQHPTDAHRALIQADLRMLDMPEADNATKTALRAHLLEERKKWAWRRLIDAVKARDPGAILSCFAAPPAVILDLLGRLAEQVWLRGAKRLRQG